MTLKCDINLVFEDVIVVDMHLYSTKRLKWVVLKGRILEVVLVVGKLESMAVVEDSCLCAVDPADLDYVAQERQKPRRSNMVTEYCGMAVLFDLEAVIAVATQSKNSSFLCSLLSLYLLSQSRGSFFVIVIVSAAGRDNSADDTVSDWQRLLCCCYSLSRISRAVAAAVLVASSQC